MGLLATANTFLKVPSKLTIASTANAVGTGKTAGDGWCCAGFCSNGGITGGYCVQVGSETPAVTIALGLPADLGVMQLDTLLPQATNGGRDGFVEGSLGALNVFLHPDARHQQNIR